MSCVSECKYKVVKLDYTSGSHPPLGQIEVFSGGKWVKSHTSEYNIQEVIEAWNRAKKKAEEPQPITKCAKDGDTECFCHHIKTEWEEKPPRDWVTPPEEWIHDGTKYRVPFEVTKKVGIAYGVCDDTDPNPDPKPK